MVRMSARESSAAGLENRNAPANRCPIGLHDSVPSCRDGCLREKRYAVRAHSRMEDDDNNYGTQRKVTVHNNTLPVYFASREALMIPDRPKSIDAVAEIAVARPLFDDLSATVREPLKPLGSHRMRPLVTCILQQFLSSNSAPYSKAKSWHQPNRNH